MNQCMIVNLFFQYNVSKIYDEPEAPNEGACLRYSASESPNEGAVFKIYDEPELPNEGACLRYIVRPNR